jgi:hypothetical protein
MIAGVVTSAIMGLPLYPVLYVLWKAGDVGKGRTVVSNSIDLIFAVRANLPSNAKQ